MDILDLREYRDKVEIELAEKANLVTIRPNFPGEDKRNIYTNFASLMGLIDIMKFIKAEKVYSSYSEEGLIFYIITNEEKERLKNIAMSSENWFQLGRLLDIDVRSSDGVMSRNNSKISMRKCYICNNPAHICVRMHRHHFWEIEKFFRQTVINYLYEGTREESFAKIFIFASSMEYYKYLDIITENSWKISINEKEMDYLKLIGSIYNKISENRLNLTDQKNLDEFSDEIVQIENDFELIDRNMVYILVKFLRAYCNKKRVSFKELIDSTDDILRIVTLTESINERKDLKEGLYILVSMLIKEREKFNLSDNDVEYLKRLENLKDRKRIREFLFSREDIFKKIYNISLLSLVLLFIENTDKVVGEYDY